MGAGFTPSAPTPPHICPNGQRQVTSRAMKRHTLDVARPARTEQQGPGTLKPCAVAGPAACRIARGHHWRGRSRTRDRRRRRQGVHSRRGWRGWRGQGHQRHGSRRLRHTLRRQGHIGPTTEASARSRQARSPQALAQGLTRLHFHLSLGRGLLGSQALHRAFAFGRLQGVDRLGMRSRAAEGEGDGEEVLPHPCWSSRARVEFSSLQHAAQHRQSTVHRAGSTITNPRPRHTSRSPSCDGSRSARVKPSEPGGKGFSSPRWCVDC